MKLIGFIVVGFVFGSMVAGELAILFGRIAEVLPIVGM